MGTKAWMRGAAAVLLLTTPALAETNAERRLRILEETVKQQQEEIRQLRQELKEKPAPVATTPSGEGKPPKTETTEAKAEPKGFELPKWLEKITLFGDVRIRHEGFYHRPDKDGGDSLHDRNRERFRARVGLKYTYSDELSATIRLATGNPDDPISTNETFTGDFSRKNINLDWAFMTLSPGKTFGLRPGMINVTAGKFPNPMFRVGELVFDDDLSVEGAGETFNVLAKPVGPLDQVRLHVQEWTFSEIANQQDGWMIGGQINPVMHAGPFELEGGIGQYWWLNADLIAQALNTNSVLVNTNIIETVPDGDDTKVVGYASAFNQTNLTIAATLPDAVMGMPLRLFTDYVYNWEAATDNRQGVMAGVKLGQTKVRGDWAITGLYEFLGQEAAISAFVWSDFGNGGTNQQGPVFSLDYQLLDPLTLTARTYLTNYIDRPADTHNPTQLRLQLDAQVRF
jgi:hypothetical protein